MPQTKLSARDRALQYKKYGFYHTGKNIVMCKYCDCQVAWERKDSLDKHLKTSKHVSMFEAKKNNTSQLQTSMDSCINSVEKRRKTADYLGKRVVETFLKANIPLHKLENEYVKSFFDEFVQGSGDIPCMKLLREKHIPMIREDREDDLKSKLRGENVSLFCDETTDSRGACIFIVLFNISSAFNVPEIVVGDVHSLKTADAKTCSRAVLDTLKKYHIPFDNVNALVSDSAPYMIKCFDTIRELLSDEAIVVQCWAHKLNLVLLVIGKHLPELQAVVSKVKSAFLNSRKRKHLFRSFLDRKYPDKQVPLFPMPVLTRWSSWYGSVSYLSEYLADVVTFLKSEDVVGVNNSGVDFLSNLNDEDLIAAQATASFVADVGGGIVELIKFLEGNSYPTVHVLSGRLQQIEQTLDVAACGVHCGRTKEQIEMLDYTDLRKKTIKTLNDAASHGATKLAALRASDPANFFYKCVSLLDHAEIAQNNVTTDLIVTLKKISFFSKLENSVIARGYTQLQSAVKEKICSKEKVDLVSILQGMSLNYPDFAAATFQTIWMPCANADSERFFSTYGNVLNDKRHRLSQANTNLFTELYFEK